MKKSSVIITKRFDLKSRLISVVAINFIPFFMFFLVLLFQEININNIMFVLVLFLITMPVSIYISFYYNRYYDVYINSEFITFVRQKEVIKYETTKYGEIKIEHIDILNSISNVCYFKVDNKKYRVRYELLLKNGYKIVPEAYSKEDTERLHKVIEGILNDLS